MQSISTAWLQYIAHFEPLQAFFKKYFRGAIPGRLAPTR